MKEIYQRQIITQNDVLVNLGRISINFSFLEEIITECINMLIGSKVAPIITAGLPFSRLLKLLRALYLQKYSIGRNEELPQNLIDILNRADQANQKRNTIIHSFWHADDSNGTVQRIKRQLDKKGLHTDIQEIDMSELASIAEDIENAAASAQDFMISLFFRFTTIQEFPADQAMLTNTPTFKWTAMEDAIGYELQISTDTSFLNLLVSATGVNLIQDSKYYPKIQFETNKVYYWRVRGILPTNLGLWSEISSFIIKNTD